MGRAMWLGWGEGALLSPPEVPRRVMEAGLRLFDVMGFPDTSVEDVRLQSEVSVGTIYHYFGNKEGLAAALYVQALIGYRRELLAVLTAPEAFGPPEEVVRGLVGRQLRWIAREPARARLLDRRREIADFAVARPWTRDLDRRFVATIAGWYRPLAQRGELRLIPQPLLSAIWMGPAHEYARLALRQTGELVAEELETAERLLGDAVWATLRPG